ncbi:MAG: hypothetical protein M0Z28_18215 [Rhodospirillales bacterium]|nr:hypothetical protein [Rhodospirillales bacterium]
MVDDYLANVGTDAEALARDGDALVSALTGGAANQTVSDRVALAERRGAWWARWFCAVLSLAVQPDHCGAMFRRAPVPWWAYPRAAFCFAFVLVGLPWMLLAPSAALCGGWIGLMAVNLAWGALL